MLPYAFVMTTLTITSKGQVTLRKDVMKHLGVGPGQKVVVDMLSDGCIIVKAESTGRISDAFNLLKTKSSQTLSIEQINAVAASGWAGKR